VAGNYAYVADEVAGLLVINKNNPVSPSLSDSYDTVGTSYGVDVEGNFGICG